MTRSRARWRYVCRRLFSAAVVLTGVATLVFVLLHLVPGDPAVSMLGEGAAPQDVAALRTRLGLNRPLHEQYRAFMSGVMTGRLGTSFRYGTPVVQEIGHRLPYTVLLGVAAMIVAVCVGGALGIVGAVWRGTAIDHVTTAMSLIGISVPAFWLGPLLALVFAVRLGWLPVSGSGSAAHLLLPAVTLGGALAAILARVTRASLIEELREPYLVMARAKGVSPSRLVLRHALRNSLIPVVTVVGLQVGAVLTGAIVTETIFAWPGIGRLLIQAIGFRDYPLVQGCILFVAATYVAVNLVIDLLYGWLDPRIRSS